MTRPTMANLDTGQRARADAVVHARYVVGRREDGTVDAMDVHALASFILDGGDPWEGIRTVEGHVDQPVCGEPDPDGGTRGTCTLPWGHDSHFFEEAAGRVLTLHRLDGAAIDVDDAVGNSTGPYADDEGGDDG